MPYEFYRQNRKSYVTNITVQTLLLLLAILSPWLNDVTDWPLWLRVAFLVVIAICVSTIGSVIGITISLWVRDRRQYKAYQRAVTMLRRILTTEQRTQFDQGQPISIPVIIRESSQSQQIGYAELIGRHVVWTLYTGIGDNQHLRAYGQCVYCFPPANRIDDWISKVLWIRTDPIGLAKVSNCAGLLQQAAQDMREHKRAHNER